MNNEQTPKKNYLAAEEHTAVKCSVSTVQQKAEIVADLALVPRIKWVAPLQVQQITKESSGLTWQGTGTGTVWLPFWTIIQQVSPTA